MKRLRISKLMDEYTDTEFFPTGGSVVDPGRVKARVLARVKAQAPRKRMPGRKKVLLAAALAAVLLMLMGAGYPFIRQLLVKGELSFRQTASGRITSFVSYGDIVECEDDRLIFIRDDDQRIDITDLVSGETPYIYDGSDPDAGLTYYIIMGGTPESFGWFTWVRTPYPFEDTADPDVDEDGFYTAYDFGIRGGDSQPGHMMGMGIVEWDDKMDLPWLLAGAEQLGITFVEPPADVQRVK